MNALYQKGVDKDLVGDVETETHCDGDPAEMGRYKIPATHQYASADMHGQSADVYRHEQETDEI